MSLLVGDNTLVHSLRILTSLELFMNAQFYCNHPCFLSAVNEHPECFGKSIHNLLPFSVFFEALGTGSVKHDLVKQEAISNCNCDKWPSFVCILGLSFVLPRTIFTFYPDCGELKFKVITIIIIITIFNQDVHSQK